MHAARRLIIALLIAGGVLWHLDTIHSRQWSVVSYRVGHSLVRLTYPLPEDPSQTAICTGIVIHQLRGYILTAHHCLNEGKIAGMVAEQQEPVRLLYTHEALDVAIISANIRTPAIRPQFRTVVGEDIAVFGYAYGLQYPMFRHLSVMSRHQRLPPNVLGDVSSTKWFLLSHNMIGGMSGGPVFNRRGELVGLIQRTNQTIGLALPIQEVFLRTCQYWQHVPCPTESPDVE